MGVMATYEVVVQIQNYPADDAAAAKEAVCERLEDLGHTRVIRVTQVDKPKQLSMMGPELTPPQVPDAPPAEERLAKCPMCGEVVREVWCRDGSPKLCEAKARCFQLDPKGPASVITMAGQVVRGCLDGTGTGATGVGYIPHICKGGS